MRPMSRCLIALVILAVVAGCRGDAPNSGEATIAETPAPPLAGARAEGGTGAAPPETPAPATPVPTRSAQSTPIPGTPRPSPSAGSARTSPTPTPARSGSAGGRQFAIDQRARGERLQSIELLVRSAELTDSVLALRVAFVNTTDEAVRVTGSVSGRDALLRDAAGAESKPTEVSDRLRTGITPESSGFVPSAATVGTITFPRPSGDGPFEFRLPSFAPVQFTLDRALQPPPSLALPQGSFPAKQALRTGQRGLERIEMRVATVRVDGRSLSIDLGFANIGRQGYELITGPKGGDARLLDADGSPVAPTTVSDSLKSSIGPTGGWQAGQENTGTISFPLPRPEAARELRLVFPGYDAVTLRFTDRTLAESRVTSPTGGSPRPAPTPSAADAAVTELEDLLARQARAIQGRDAAGYLDTFTAGARTAQQAVFDRAGKMPITGYTLKLAPDARLDGADRGKLDSVSVVLSYALKDVSADNTFLHLLDYDLVREGTAWKVGAVDADENPPFWLGGDVLLRETPHFLIVARPNAQAELPALAQEVEVAYEALRKRNLPLESRYVAYFTAEGSDFTKLTGRPAGRYLGVALARYDLQGDAILARSRAFYINGAAFMAGNRRGTRPEERQETVTHELVHLALSKDSRPFTPPWLAEGMAVFLAGETDDDLRRRLVTDGKLDPMSLDKLTRAGSLGEHDVLGTNGAYEYIFSGEAIAYLMQTFGEAKVLEFYRSYAAMPAGSVREKMPRFGGSFAADAVFADLSAQLTADAVRRIFGRDLAQLESEIKTWIRR